MNWPSLSLSITCFAKSHFRKKHHGSEKGSERVLAMLNSYFEEAVSIIHRHDGILQTFMGDGLMAYFGAPVDIVNPCENAWQSAIAMLEAVNRLNQKLNQDEDWQALAAQLGHAPVKIGIGLHIGVALMGNCGARNRYQYTPIGNVVNVAARLESQSKELGCDIVISSAFRARLNKELIQPASLSPAEVIALRQPDYFSVVNQQVRLKGFGLLKVYGFRQSDKHRV